MSKAYLCLYWINLIITTMKFRKNYVIVHHIPCLIKNHLWLDITSYILQFKSSIILPRGKPLFEVLLRSLNYPLSLAIPFQLVYQQPIVVVCWKLKAIWNLPFPRNFKLRGIDFSLNLTGAFVFWCDMIGKIYHKVIREIWRFRHQLDRDAHSLETAEGTRYLSRHIIVYNLRKISKKPITQTEVRIREIYSFGVNDNDLSPLQSSDQKKFRKQRIWLEGM